MTLARPPPARGRQVNHTGAGKRTAGRFIPPSNGAGPTVDPLRKPNGRPVFASLPLSGLRDPGISAAWVFLSARVTPPTLSVQASIMQELKVGNRYRENVCDISRVDVVGIKVV